jgi:hypothetical protein
MEIIKGNFGKAKEEPKKKANGALEVINAMSSLPNIAEYEDCLIILRGKENNMLSFASNMNIESLIFVLEQVKLSVMMGDDEELV